MIKEIVKKLKSDYNKRTVIFAFLSVLAIICFTVYNGILGFLYDSIWHICIFAYYVFLLLIKGLLVFGISNKKTRNNQLTVVYITFMMLIIMTIAMIAPAFILVLDKRTYNLGLIPSIASAAYTTYSIVVSILNMKKAKSAPSPIIKQISLVNIANALMSILVLQNTLILANGGYTDDLKKLSIASSAGIIVLIIIGGKLQLRMFILFEKLQLRTIH